MGKSPPIRVMADRFVPLAADLHASGSLRLGLGILVRLQLGIVCLPLCVDHSVGVHQLLPLALGQLVKNLHLTERLLQLGQGPGQRAALKRDRFRLASDGKTRSANRVFCIGEKIQLKRQLFSLLACWLASVLRLKSSTSPQLFFSGRRARFFYDRQTDVVKNQRPKTALINLRYQKCVLFFNFSFCSITCSSKSSTPTNN